MFKKILLFIVAIMLSATLGVIVYASYNDTIQATRVQYPIIVDGSRVDKDVSMVSIEDRIYLPIRAMCEVLGIGIEWNEEGRVEIMTDTSDVENDRVGLGCYGIDGWTTVETFDLELTKETAVIIADDVFSQIKGNDFVNETTVGIRETEDGKCYSVYRYNELVPGGDLSIIIRKSDGKILRIEAGE